MNSPGQQTCRKISEKSTDCPLTGGGSGLGYTAMSKPHNTNPLTASEKSALDTFAKLARRLGYNPTSGELAKELDVTPTTAAGLIGRLRNKGKLVRNGAGWRKTGVVK